MNYINQLLPQMRLIKAESSSKDKKQRQFYPKDDQSNLSQNDNTDTLIDGENIVWDFTERRQGKDRRQSDLIDSKWLDVRSKKNRRKPTLYMQV
ncbi:hypothetical protein AAD001_03410 [Colwelliaceae bacterium 6471]